MDRGGRCADVDAAEDEDDEAVVFLVRGRGVGKDGDSRGSLDYNVQ